MTDPTLAPTLTSALYAAAALDPHRGYVFLDRHERETPLSFDALLDGALRVAGALAERGVAPGERVALVLPTSPGFLMAFFGCQLAGAVPCPIYPPVRLGHHDEYVERSAATLRKADAVALITDGRIRRLLGEVAERLRPRCGVLRVDALLRAPRPAHPPHSPAPDDLGLVQFSSGTTRVPAAVGLSHRQLLANVDAMLAVLPDEVRDRGGVCWLPLYHDMGLVGCVLATLRAASRLVLIDPIDFLARPALWLRAMGRFDAACSPAPDFAYARCVERVDDADLDGIDLGGWLAALDGAEPIASATLRRFQARFQRFGLRPEALTPVYGLAEAALGVTFGRLDSPFRSARFERDTLARGHAAPTHDESGLELAGVGRALPGFAVRIVARDSESHLDEDGAVGRIQVCGPSITSGYLGGDRAPLTDDGWLDTGDLGFVHDDELFVCGRSRDIVILRGRNHSPHDIEHALDGVPGVRTGCTVAVGELSSDGERLVVFVERRQPAPETLEDDCRRAIRRATALDPERIVLLEPGTLPRTSSGKLRRAETLARWQRGELVPPHAVTRRYLARRVARSLVGHWRSGRAA